MRILVMGLPGAGKTTLSQVLAKRLGGVHLNADEVRQHVNRDLGFSPEDRVEQARRMGWIAGRVAEATFAIADFVCPTPEARGAFGPAFTVWCDRIQISRFPDTNALFVPPDSYDIRVTADGTPEFWASQIVERVRPTFDPEAPTALFIGRYQPFHDGHKALIEEGIRRVGQACIAVRGLAPSAQNPLPYEAVKARIEAAMGVRRYQVVRMPNITHVFYGRDVGYVVERLVMPETVEQISGTAERAKERLTGGV